MPNPMIKTLSEPAKKVVEAYVSTPYFNNRRTETRAGLRALVGKGTPEEITEEAGLFAVREKVILKNLSADQRRQFLVEHRLGVDCSGFVFHVLNAEARALGKKSLASGLALRSVGPFGIFKFLARLRPAQNADVAVFADSANSRSLALVDIRPGDFVVMLHEKADRAFNHIVLITEVAYEESSAGLVPKRLTYTHSIAWPTDGKYNHGVRTGTINITNSAGQIQDQTWTENGQTGEQNYTHQRALKATSCSLRRLSWF